MEKFVKKMIKEHATLVVNIDKLSNYIDNNSNDDDKEEYALKQVQLNAMQMYEHALWRRLRKQGIEYSSGKYHELIGVINRDIESEEDSDDNDEGK